MPLPEYASDLGSGTWKVDVWVQPGARRDQVEGLYQGRLKVRLAAPAVEGKANKAVIAFVAGLLGIRPRQVRLETGLRRRRKSLIVESESEPVWPVL